MMLLPRARRKRPRPCARRTPEVQRRRGYWSASSARNRRLADHPSSRERPRPSIVVVGASAGGVDALRAFVGSLAPGFDGAVFAVLHTGAAPSLLDRILASSTRLRVSQATDGEPIRGGHI